MVKRSGSPNAPSGNVLHKGCLLIVAVFLFHMTGWSQAVDSLLPGQWFEVQKKKGRYHVPLQVQLNADSTATYINLYPERSYNLRWSLSADSCLTMKDGSRYKLLFVDSALMRLKTIHAGKNKIILLRKGGSRPRGL